MQECKNAECAKKTMTSHASAVMLVAAAMLAAQQAAVLNANDVITAKLPFWFLDVITLA